MNISLNIILMNIRPKKYQFLYKNSKCLKNSILFRNIYNLNQKFIIKNRRNGLIFENNNKFNKVLLESNYRSRIALIVLNISSKVQHLDDLSYERIADKTLDDLNEEFEQIIESNSDFKDSDVSLNNGVITLNLGQHGVYVINKQSPNKQIWLSSPISGPKRYDYLNNDWIYKRDGISLHCLLSSELSEIFKQKIVIRFGVKDRHN